MLRNVTLAPQVVLGRSRAEAEARAAELLARFGLADKRDEYPDRLSGGQQQRAAIVRALAMEPELMLLDEVTSALDPELVAEVLEVIRELAAGGMTMLIATHEMSFAREIADRVCFLDEGVVLEQGPPEQIFSAPQRAADAAVPPAHRRRGAPGALTSSCVLDPLSRINDVTLEPLDDFLVIEPLDETETASGLIVPINEAVAVRDRHRRRGRPGRRQRRAGRQGALPAGRRLRGPARPLEPPRARAQARRADRARARLTLRLSASAEAGDRAAPAR